MVTRIMKIKVCNIAGRRNREVSVMQGQYNTQLYKTQCTAQELPNGNDQANTVVLRISMCL